MKQLVVLLLGAVLVTASTSGPAGATTRAAAAQGQVVVVQAVPGAKVGVSVDGRSLRQDAAVGTLIGPVSLSPGAHELTFEDVPGGPTVATKITVEPGSSSDVVLHLPAAVNGQPVVNTYRTPDKPIGPGKARVLLAHTATVAPADVQLDGKVVFTNIANGEYADADVPAGSHKAALYPTGDTSDPILGPLDVTLAARTATMVYAVGSPSNGSMNAIVHTVDLAADGSTVPRSMDTGSAGLAARVQVTPFSGRAPDPRGAARIAEPRAEEVVWLAVAGLLVVGVAGVFAACAVPPFRRRAAARTSLRL